MKLTLILRRAGDAEEVFQSFSVDLKLIDWGSIESEVFDVHRGASRVGCRKDRQNGVRTGEITSVTLDMTFGLAYDSAFVAFKNLLAALEQKSVDAEEAAKATSSVSRKSFMAMAG